jgi:hypothetical protein
VLGLDIGLDRRPTDQLPAAAPAFASGLFFEQALVRPNAVQCTVSPRALQPAKHLNNNAITRTMINAHHRKQLGQGARCMVAIATGRWLVKSFRHIVFR